MLFFKLPSGGVKRKRPPATTVWQGVRATGLLGGVSLLLPELEDLARCSWRAHRVHGPRDKGKVVDRGQGRHRPGLAWPRKTGAPRPDLRHRVSKGPHPTEVLPVKGFSFQ